VALLALIAVTAVWGVITFVQAEAPLSVPTIEGARALPARPS
jgi:hypothetical protein